MKPPTLLSSLSRGFLILVGGLGMACSLSAQTFTTLHTFTGGIDGGVPEGVLLSGSTLYGAAVDGGYYGNGVIFSLNTNGTGFTVLHSFTNESDGAEPVSVIASGNTLYGVAGTGGTSYGGTIFSISTNGTGFTTLYSFSGSAQNSNGSGPVSLILSGGTLYGTTGGGASNAGTIFSISTNGTGFTTIHSFTGGSDGVYPNSVILSGGTLYGTTAGRASNAGTIFSVSTNGTGFTTIHSFTGGIDGAGPQSVILSGNTIYGGAVTGGSSGYGPSGYGTLYSVNTDGTGFTVLYSFTNGSDGAHPGVLILSGGILYGMAGGEFTNPGTLFSVSTNGTGFTTLYSFTGGSDGAYPYSVILSGNTLYGGTQDGGSSAEEGTLFSFSLSGTNTSSTNVGNNSLADDPTFVAALVSNPDFLTSLANVITNTPGGYGILQQGPQGIQGPVGPTGATGLQGATGVFDPTVLTNTAFLTGLAANSTFVSSLATNSNFVSILATNSTFVSALATNPAFISTLVSQITSSATNYGIASKGVQTLTFPTIPTQTYAPSKKVILNATSSAKLAPITYSIANPAIALISNNIILIQGTGTTTVTATQTGNAYFNPATATQSLKVK